MLLMQFYCISVSKKLVLDVSFYNRESKTISMTPAPPDLYPRYMPQSVYGQRLVLRLFLRLRQLGLLHDKVAQWRSSHAG